MTRTGSVSFQALPIFRLFCLALYILGLVSENWLLADPVDHNAVNIVGWADGVVSYLPGSGLGENWQDTAEGLGEAGIKLESIVSLGEGGSIVLSFSLGISNGQGLDFAVFENGFSETFLELAWVEVSSDGINFVRFPNASETPSPVPTYGQIDPDHISGLAGKYAFGWGTPFDLEDLLGMPGSDFLNFSNITYVRLVDIVGDGSVVDSNGQFIYDPYPTFDSAGFDLDGVAVINAGTAPAQDEILILSFHLIDNAYTITWQSQPGIVYEIHHSVDLNTWNRIASVTASVNSCQWTGDIGQEMTGFFVVNTILP